jgi:hypothetical protein
MSKIYYTKEERRLIPIGSIIQDVEDGDCWFEGKWLGDNKYLCTSVFWCGELYKTKEEDDKIGTIQSAQWFYLRLKKDA